MSGHRYTNSNDLFGSTEGDDIDDETFLRNSRRNNTYDEQRQSYLERRREIEDRTLNSTDRSISLLRDSEQIGIVTAEELMRQREQLERTDKRLSEINQTLRFSQKHINGIKSVFGSLKNYISGRNDPNTPVSTSSPLPETSPVDATNQYDAYENHPSVRLRSSEANIHQPVQMSSGSKDFTARLDANLHEMHSSISKLKGLATDLSVEIDSQHDLISTITDKAEHADLTINKQNKDINRLLRK